MKNHKDSKKNDKKERIFSALQIPKDISEAAVLMWVTGRKEVCLENYRCIIAYTEEYICLQAKHYKVVIKGKNLNIDYYTSEMMQISGCIDSISYQ